MGEPKQIRLNDVTDPDRADKFQKSLERTAASGNTVIRQLVDAFNRYVNQHGHAPTFPIDIVPTEKVVKKKR